MSAKPDQAQILDTALETEGVGGLEETLRWGEPSYITKVSKSGSTVRIGWKESNPRQYGLYFHCSTKLVDTFREIHGDRFTFEGNRAIIFDEGDDVPEEELTLMRHFSERAMTLWD